MKWLGVWRNARLGAQPSDEPQLKSNLHLKPDVQLAPTRFAHHACRRLSSQSSTRALTTACPTCLARWGQVGSSTPSAHCRHAMQCSVALAVGPAQWPLQHTCFIDELNALQCRVCPAAAHPQATTLLSHLPTPTVRSWFSRELEGIAPCSSCSMPIQSV